MLCFLLGRGGLLKHICMQVGGFGDGRDAVHACISQSVRHCRGRIIQCHLLNGCFMIDYTYSSFTFLLPRFVWLYQNLVVPSYPQTNN